MRRRECTLFGVGMGMGSGFTCHPYRGELIGGAITVSRWSANIVNAGMSGMASHSILLSVRALQRYLERRKGAYSLQSIAG